MTKFTKSRHLPFDAGHHDLDALGIIEQALAIPIKRADRPLIGFLTRSETQAILDGPEDATSAGRRDRVLFSLMYNTGARVSEIIGIRCRDIVPEGQSAVHLHGKGRKERCVPLWRPTAALVWRWQRSLGANAQDGFLLPNRAGAKMTRSNVTQRLDLAVAAARRELPSLAGRSISLHEIRHAENIDYGEMIHVRDGTEEGLTTFTDRGIENLQ